MDLNKIEIEIFKLLKRFNSYANDEIPSDFDFENNVAVSFNLAGVASDESYRDDIDLEIRVISIKENKEEVQNSAKIIDKNLNKINLFFGRIVRQNIWLVSMLDDENKYNIVLQYYIINYEE